MINLFRVGQGCDECFLLHVVVVVCLPGRNGVTPIFRSFHRTASSITGGWSRWNILMGFLYIILSTTVHF